MSQTVVRGLARSTGERNLGILATAASDGALPSKSLGHATIAALG